MHEGSYKNIIFIVATCGKSVVVPPTCTSVCRSAPMIDVIDSDSFDPLHVNDALLYEKCPPFTGTCIVSSVEDIHCMYMIALQ